MATKKKKPFEEEEYKAPTASNWYSSFSSGSGAKSGGKKLPKGSDYEPFQGKTAGYGGELTKFDDDPLPSIAEPRAPGRQLGSEEMRTQARQGYNYDMSDVNRRLMEAASQYGNANEITQYGYDASGADNTYMGKVTANPNSIWENLGRWENEGRRTVSEDLNNRGSFFSGEHINRRNQLTDEAGRQRLQATTDFNSLLNDLNSMILRSRGSRDSAMREADIMDALAAAEAARLAGSGASSPGGAIVMGAGGTPTELVDRNPLPGETLAPPVSDDLGPVGRGGGRQPYQGGNGGQYSLDGATLQEILWAEAYKKKNPQGAAALWGI